MVTEHGKIRLKLNFMTFKVHDCKLRRLDQQL